MDFLWEALLDSLKLLPFLLISYVIIEVIEYFCAAKMESNRLLTGKYGVLIGSSFGLIPQCGFSVVATDLFSSHRLSIGSLMAIYIATSDEAIPTLLLYPDKMLSLLPLLLIKFVVAIIVGYSIDGIFKSANKKHLELAKTETHTHEHEDNEVANSSIDGDHLQDSPHHTGCCGHEIEGDKKNFAKIFILHPIIHTLKIFLFILIVNIVFSGLIALVTEERLMAFLASSKWFAPLLASLVGLIPNCAASVVLTSFYVHGGIGFGAMMAGLIINAGIALVVLFKQNKNQKQNLCILGGLYAIGLVTGYLIELILLLV